MDRLAKCLNCDAVLEDDTDCGCATPWVIMIASRTPVDDRLMRTVLKEVLHSNESRLNAHERELIQRKLIALAP